MLYVIWLAVVVYECCWDSNDDGAMVMVCVCNTVGDCGGVVGWWWW